MTIGIISAMDSEHRRLVERLQDKNTSGDGSFRYVEGTLGGNHVILTQCGIGKVSAAVGASELIRRFSEGDGCSGKPTSGVSRRLVRRR